MTVAVPRMWRVSCVCMDVSVGVDTDVCVFVLACVRGTACVFFEEDLSMSISEGERGIR